MIQYDFTEFLAYNDKADFLKCKGFVICFDFQKICASYVKHLAQRATEACWSMAKINRAKEYVRKGTVMISFFLISIAGAFDKSSLKDGEGATETKNL